MPYWMLGCWFFGTALSLGWIAGPATESIMGAVPEEKSGVASAMNDVTRQVAGALGTAVVGSIITTLYASRMSDSVAGLPEESRVAAEDSIGMANAVAATLPAEQGQQLTDAAADAFTEALALGFLATGVVAAHRGRHGQALAAGRPPRRRARSGGALPSPRRSRPERVLRQQQRNTVGAGAWPAPTCVRIATDGCGRTSRAPS